MKNMNFKSLIVSIAIALMFLLEASEVAAINLQVQKNHDGKEVAFILSGLAFSVTHQSELYGGRKPLPPIELTDSSEIFIRSPGGNPNGPVWIINWLTMQLDRTRAVPTVYVFDRCESACVVLLTALNKLADQHRIQLILSSALVVGFHGSIIDENTYTTPDQGQIAQIREYGGNGIWLEQHKSYFTRPTVDFIRWHLASAPIFSGSGIVDPLRVKSGIIPLIRGILNTTRSELLFEGALPADARWILSEKEDFIQD